MTIKKSDVIRTFKNSLRHPRKKSEFVALWLIIMAGYSAGSVVAGLVWNGGFFAYLTGIAPVGFVLAGAALAATLLVTYRRRDRHERTRPVQ